MKYSNRKVFKQYRFTIDFSNPKKMSFWNWYHLCFDNKEEFAASLLTKKNILKWLFYEPGVHIYVGNCLNEVKGKENWLSSCKRNLFWNTKFPDPKPRTFSKFNFEKRCAYHHKTIYKFQSFKIKIY
jgi:hypothetical protein